MTYEVGDVIQTSEWSDKWNGLYLILNIEPATNDPPAVYVCRQFFCQEQLKKGERSFTAGINKKVGHIDDISSFVSE